jgi:hypothetical protein
LEQEAQKPKVSYKLFSAVSNNNLLIASSMLQPYYTQVSWVVLYLGLEDGGAILSIIRVL